VGNVAGNCRSPLDLYQGAEAGHSAKIVLDLTYRRYCHEFAAALDGTMASAATKRPLLRYHGALNMASQESSMGSEKDKIKGTVNQAVGRIKQAASHTEK